MILLKHPNRLWFPILHPNVVKNKILLFLKKDDDSRKLVNFMKKLQGRKISRMLRNKSRKTANVNSPIQIEDEELVKNQEVSSP
jgi:hypothetical protein